MKLRRDRNIRILRKDILSIVTALTAVLRRDVGLSCEHTDLVSTRVDSNYPPFLTFCMRTDNTFNCQF